MSPTNGQDLRRSSRVPIQVPVHVTCMEPNSRFSEVCETLVVSAHGCAFRFPIPLSAGSALHLHTREGREATAYVVACQPLGAEGQGWRLGARLDRPDNFWGLESYPDDWRVLEMPAQAAPQPRHKSAAPVLVPKSQTPANASQAILHKIEEQLSDDRLRGILAKLVRPLEAEVGELREKLSRHGKQNRFEVSLGQIPPELEEKLWERLRRDLGARVLEYTREQSTEILGSTKAATEQKIGAALTEFRHRLSGELHAVEQRAQVLTKELTANTRQQVQAGVEKLQQLVLEAGANLCTHGDKVASSLEQRLVETHVAHRREIEEVHSTAAAQASKLQSEITDLIQRVSVLNESVRHQEVDLDAHLERVSGAIVSEARIQLKNAVDQALKDFQAGSSNEVDARLDQVCSHLRTIQNRIENSFSGSLQTQGEEAAQSVERQFEELAMQSMERWRHALAKDLNSVAQALGQQLRGEVEPETDRSLRTAG